MTQILLPTHRVTNPNFNLHTARSAVVSFEPGTSTCQEIQAPCRARGGRAHMLEEMVHQALEAAPAAYQDTRCRNFWRRCGLDTINVHRE